LERCAGAAERVAKIVEGEELADRLACLLLLGFRGFLVVSARGRVGCAETVGAETVVVRGGGSGHFC
jgi:hypothetical protein